jgi:hypothetical protein
MNIVVQSPSVTDGPVQRGRSLSAQTDCQTKVIQATCADVRNAMNRPPFNQFYNYFTPTAGVIPSAPADMNGQYNHADYRLNVPMSTDINPFIQFGVMARYCRNVPPAPNQWIATRRVKPQSSPCTDAPDSAWPPLHALDEFLNSSAPHYDMTNRVRACV